MVLLAVIGYLTAQGRNVFEENGQSSVVRVRVELVRGMRDMVVDVMELNSVGGAARGRDQLRGSWTSTASVPLQERQPALRVEKVAHCVRHGSRSFANVPSGSTRGRDFGKATNPDGPGTGVWPLWRTSLGGAAQAGQPSR